MNKQNILIIGGSSIASLDFAKTYLNESDANFYGLTSKSINRNGEIKLVHYDQIDQLDDITFDMVCIFASRLPSEGIKINEYMKTNKLILSCLHSIKYNLNYGKVLFISSFAVYGEKETYINEDSKVYTTHPYSKAKIDLENKLTEISNFITVNKILRFIKSLKFPIILIIKCVIYYFFKN